RLSSVAGDTGAPATVPVTVRATPPGSEVLFAEALGVGSGAVHVYLPRGTAYLAATTAPPGWVADPSEVSVGATATDVTARISLSLVPVGTTTAVTATPTSIDPGDSLTLQAAVSSGSGAPDAGTVTF